MAEKRFLIKNCNRIIRKTQAHLDIVLKEYSLSSGSYSYLLVLAEEEGINLDRISKKLGVDKAMSTRTIQKLLELGYLTKLPDETDYRAFRLYLTDKGRACIPEVKSKIERWIDTITEGLTVEEQKMADSLLEKIAENAEHSNAVGSTCG